MPSASAAPAVRKSAQNSAIRNPHLPYCTFTSEMAEEKCGAALVGFCAVWRTPVERQLMRHAWYFCLLPVIACAGGQTGDEGTGGNCEKPPVAVELDAHVAALGFSARDVLSLAEGERSAV